MVRSCGHPHLLRSKVDTPNGPMRRPAPSAIVSTAAALMAPLPAIAAAARRGQTPRPGQKKNRHEPPPPHPRPRSSATMIAAPKRKPMFVNCPFGCAACARPFSWDRQPKQSDAGPVGGAHSWVPARRSIRCRKLVRTASTRGGFPAPGSFSPAGCGPAANWNLSIVCGFV